MTDLRSSIGIDLGSRMTKIVHVVHGRVSHFHSFDTGHDPLPRIEAWLEPYSGEPKLATGYGRHLAGKRLGCRVVTEISACARGARHVLADCRSIIDIGGQDSKAIELSLEGAFGAFEMNDRCAAGTGKFLEVMACTLGFSLEEFGREALAADRPVTINSLCTVFAESEVVSLVAAGEDRRRIAKGLHLGTARRIAAMASRVKMAPPVLFVGGVALNPCMAWALAEELGQPVVVPEHPELVVALGAALLAADTV